MHCSSFGLHVFYFHSLTEVGRRTCVLVACWL